MTKLIEPAALHTLLSDGVKYQEAGLYLESAHKNVDTLEMNATTVGFREGWQQSQNQMLATVQTINQTFLDKRVALEPALTALVLACLNKIIATMPNDEVIRSVVETALSDHGELAGITLRVPHKDVAEYRSALGLQSNQHGNTAGHHIPVVGDSVLEDGDIVLETPGGRIHVGIETQLRQLTRAMISAEASVTILPSARKE